MPELTIHCTNIILKTAFFRKDGVRIDCSRGVYFKRHRAHTDSYLWNTPRLRNDFWYLLWYHLARHLCDHKPPRAGTKVSKLIAIVGTCAVLFVKESFLNACYWHPHLTFASSGFRTCIMPTSFNVCVQLWRNDCVEEHKMHHSPRPEPHTSSAPRRAFAATGGATTANNRTIPLFVIEGIISYHINL